jgi:hypothetical protein
VVAADARLEILQQALRAAHAGGELQLAQIGTHESHRLERWRRHCRCTRERLHVRADDEGRQRIGAQARQPRILVRGEHAERPPLAR